MILLTDIVVSAKTLREKYNEIKIKRNVIILPFSIIYCVNSNNLNDNVVKDKVQIPNGDSVIELHYLLQRKQDYQNKETGKCVMCGKKLNIAKKNLMIKK